MCCATGIELWEAKRKWEEIMILLSGYLYFYTGNWVLEMALVLGPSRGFAKWYRLDGKRSLRRSRSSYFPGGVVLLL